MSCGHFFCDKCIAKSALDSEMLTVRCFICKGAESFEQFKKRPPLFQLMNGNEPQAMKPFKAPFNKVKEIFCTFGKHNGQRGACYYCRECYRFVCVQCADAHQDLHPDDTINIHEYTVELKTQVEAVRARLTEA